MANTFTSLHYHVIFSTRNRERWLGIGMQERIWAYLGGIAATNNIKSIKIGGVEDHVHLVLGIPATLALSKAIQLLKGGSSKWFMKPSPICADLNGKMATRRSR